MLLNSLQTIAVTRGYITDLGQRVIYGKPPEASEKGKNAIYYYPLPKRIEVENSRWTHRETWEIVAILYTNAPTEMIGLVEADIWMALGTDRTLGGTVDNIMPAPENTVEYEFETAGVSAAKVAIQIELLRRTPIFTA